MWVGLLLARLLFLIRFDVYCVASSGFSIVSSDMTLPLVCTMVRVKRRVGTAVLFLSRVANGCRPTVDCVAIVEVKRLKESKGRKLEETA